MYWTAIEYWVFFSFSLRQILFEFPFSPRWILENRTVRNESFLFFFRLFFTLFTQYVIWKPPLDLCVAATVRVPRFICITDKRHYRRHAGWKPLTSLLSYTFEACKCVYTQIYIMYVYLPSLKCLRSKNKNKRIKKNKKNNVNAFFFLSPFTPRAPHTDRPTTSRQRIPLQWCPNFFFVLLSTRRNRLHDGDGSRRNAGDTRGFVYLLIEKQKASPHSASNS